MATLSKKQLSQLHKATIKESRTNLSSAAKLYCSLFGKQTDLKSVVDNLKVAGVNITPAVVKAVVDVAKDKNEVIRICAQMLANIDGKYIKFVTCQKEFSDIKLSETEGFKKDENWLKKNAVSGLSYKPFGMEIPISLSDNGEPTYKYIKTANEKVTTYRIAVALTSYSVGLIAKCVVAYLSSEDKDR